MRHEVEQPSAAGHDTTYYAGNGANTEERYDVDDILDQLAEQDVVRSLETSLGDTNFDCLEGEDVDRHHVTKA